MGTSLPFPKKGAETPKFSAHVYCGQTAGWIKLVLGTEVGLSPGDLAVLDGDPVPSPKTGRAPPQFLVHFCCGQMAGCTKMAAVRHLVFVLRVFAHPRRVLGGLCRCVKFCYNRCCSFEDMWISILGQFGLKMRIHAHFGVDFSEKWGKGKRFAVLFL